MPVNFRYWPPAPEDITGEAVLEQTETAFNDLGKVIDTDISQAIDTANQAKEAADNAVNIASSASTKADEAANIAQAASDKVDGYQSQIDTANQNASTAITTANNAADVAQNALDTAQQADTKSTTAISDARTALTNSENAVEAAGNAVATAETALSIANQSLGIYDVFSDSFDDLDFDADEFFDSPARYYIDVTATNIPTDATVPFLVDITLSSDNLAVLQTIQSNTGDVTWKRSGAVTPATEDDPASAVWSPWVRYTAEGEYVVRGKIDYLPFRPAELPPGWYFCNGDQYALNSYQGAVLNAFSDDFKTDWGIAVSDENISLPSLFYSDGRGYFLRAANGEAQTVGLSGVQDDAIRNITGTVNFLVSTIAGTSGAFVASGANAFQASYINNSVPGGFTFNAARIVPTAEENRPLNIGMTPAIYLGV